MSDERILYCDFEADEVEYLGEAVLAFGVFDGLHLGHRDLIAAACDDARQRGLPCIVITFDRDPDELFRQDDPAFGKLLSNGNRLQMLAQIGPDFVIALRTQAHILSLQPDAFLDNLAGVCTPRSIHVGSDFRFGAKAKATVGDLQEWAQRKACACVSHGLIERLGSKVSSTRVRTLLRRGDVAAVQDLLAGRPHCVCGSVVSGRGEGRVFGFATANLDLSAEEVMLPAAGVYGGFANVDGVQYPAAINVGRAASFEEATAFLEAHLIGFDGDLYGRSLKISFIQWLREPRVFDNQEELIATVMSDIAWVRENLGGGPHGIHR